MEKIDIGGNLKQVIMLVVLVAFGIIALKTGSPIAQVGTLLCGVITIFMEKAKFLGNEKE
jgi:hypothetical protein